MQEFYLSVTQILFPENSDLQTSIENKEDDEESHDNFKKVESKTERSELDNWLLHLPSGKTFTFLSILCLILTIIEWYRLRKPFGNNVNMILDIINCGQYVITIFALIFGWALYSAVCKSFMSAPQHEDSETRDAIIEALQKKLPFLKLAFRLGLTIIGIRVFFHTFHRVNTGITGDRSELEPWVSTTQILVEIVILVSIFIIICKA